MTLVSTDRSCKSACAQRTDALCRSKGSERHVRPAPSLSPPSSLFSSGRFFIFPHLPYYFSTRSRRRLGARPLVCLASSAGASPPPSGKTVVRVVRDLPRKRARSPPSEARFNPSVSPARPRPSDRRPRANRDSVRSIASCAKAAPIIRSESAGSTGRTILWRFRTRDRGDSYLRLINYCPYPDPGSSPTYLRSSGSSPASRVRSGPSSPPPSPRVRARARARLSSPRVPLHGLNP